MTTPTLEDTIRSLAARGEISHISLTPSQGGRMWRASFTMCSHFGVSFAEDKDPVEALMLAFTSAKLKKPRATLNLKPEPEPVDASDTNDADGPAPGNPIAPLANVDGGVTIDWSTGQAIDPLSDLM